MKNKNSEKKEKKMKKGKYFDMYEKRESPLDALKRKRGEIYEKNTPLHAKLISLATQNDLKVKVFTKALDKNQIKLLQKGA